MCSLHAHWLIMNKLNKLFLKQNIIMTKKRKTRWKTELVCYDVSRYAFRCYNFGPFIHLFSNFGNRKVHFGSNTKKWNDEQFEEKEKKDSKWFDHLNRAYASSKYRICNKQNNMKNTNIRYWIVFFLHFFSLLFFGCNIYEFMWSCTVDV